MRLFVRLLLVAGFASLVALPAPAGAKLEFNLPAQIFKELDDSGKTDSDPGRCNAAVFVEFPKIKHAKSYRVEVRRNDLIGRLVDFVAPPFEDTGITQGYPAPEGFGRFFVFAYSAGDGCAAVDARTEGAAEIVEAKVSLAKAFEKRFKKVEHPPRMCAYEPGERTVKLSRGGDPRSVVVRKKGTVTMTVKGSNQPVNIMTNTYVVSGTIVKTGPGSFVKIGALDGSAVLVAPHTTVRITDGGFEILEQPRHPRQVKMSPPGADYKVRTSCAVFSARG